MTTQYLTRIALLALLATALLAYSNCTSSEWGMGEWSGGPDGASPAYRLDPACDPDNYAACPDDWFLCTDDAVGNKNCEGQDFAPPDANGNWSCASESGAIVCWGDHMPSDAGGSWECQWQGAEVLCQQEHYEPGESAGSDAHWDCRLVGEQIVCESAGGAPPSSPGDTPSGGDADGDSDGPGSGGTDTCPPGVEVPSEEICGDGLDNDCNGFVDDRCDEDGTPSDDTPEGDGPEGDRPGDEDGTPEGDEPEIDDLPPDDGRPPGCLCVPGAVRYCDTPVYCNWGRQECAADGMRWGACREVAPPLICAFISSWYSPEGQACCAASGFCCQDYHDLDFDGDNQESMGTCTDITCG